MTKQLTPLERTVYLLEDIPVSAHVLMRELSDEDRGDLRHGLTGFRAIFAAANSDQELQSAGSKLLGLMESNVAWRSILLPMDMPNAVKREQWLEVHEQELVADPSTAMSVEELAKMRESIDLLFDRAITALLTDSEEQAEDE